MMGGAVQLQPPDLASAVAKSCDELDAKDLETGVDSAPCCRICLENDMDSLDGKLISPCMCKGTQQLVHRSCLDHWRSVKEGFAFSHCTTCKAQFHLRVVDDNNNSWRRKAKFRLFVTRDVFLVFFVVQTIIAALAGFAYMIDKKGKFRNSFNDNWDRILSKHPIPFYYCIGVVSFLVLIGFLGLILQCCLSSLDDNDERGMASSHTSCFVFDADDDADDDDVFLAIVIVFVVFFFAVLGLAYGVFAATMAIQKIWQKHYHILTKRELTKEYIVEDLHGCYTHPRLNPEHLGRLRMLKLM